MPSTIAALIAAMLLAAASTSTWNGTVDLDQSKFEALYGGVIAGLK